jgi:hypothetical protein
MRLSSQSSQFQFNLPSDLLQQEVINTYTPILEKNWIQYENVLDYINSTIISVNFPGISFDGPSQTLIRGKQRKYKPATNIQDIVSTHELNVTFRSVDSDLNYWMLFDIVSKHYLDVTSTQHIFVNPFTINALDIHRDSIYTINFYEIILQNLSDNTFAYNQMKVNAKEFTMTFHFNFYDIEFNLNKSKVLELGEAPVIIQRI